MNHRCFFIYLLLLAACNKSGLDSLREDTFILTAVLTGNQPAANISVFRIGTGGNSGIISLKDAEVKLSSGGVSEYLEWTGSGFEDQNGSMPVIPEVGYTINVNVRGKHLEAFTPIPPEIELLNSSSTEITVDTNSSGSAAFVLEWNAVENYEYVLELICTETTPEVIPFMVESGKFQQRFNGPTINSGALILDTDFKYYGQHRLYIHRIPAAYSAIYFFNPNGDRGYLQAGPSNVSGGRGFVTGITTMAVDLQLNP